MEYNEGYQKKIILNNPTDVFKLEGTFGIGGDNGTQNYEHIKEIDAAVCQSQDWYRSKGGSMRHQCTNAVKNRDCNNKLAEDGSMLEHWQSYAEKESWLDDGNYTSIPFENRRKHVDL